MPFFGTPADEEEITCESVLTGPSAALEWWERLLEEERGQFVALLFNSSGAHWHAADLQVTIKPEVLKQLQNARPKTK